MIYSPLSSKFKTVLCADDAYLSFSHSSPRPALASAGPEWKHFSVSRKFEEWRQVIIIEIMSDVKERGPEKVMPS